MMIIPAIDLFDGKCVRLTQGRKDAITVYSDNPLNIARNFKEQGAKLIHVVDLDGAFSGEMKNIALITRIAKIVTIEVGGGIRTKKDIEVLRKEGINRIIVGSNLMELKKYDVIGALDFKDGTLASNGWLETKEVNLISSLDGLKEVIVTDISRDGMLTGPNIDLIKKIKSYGVEVIASGGVRNIRDIENLKKFGAKGVIIGKALYEGKINLEEAIQNAY